MTNIFTRVIRAFKTWREFKKMPLRVEFVLTDYCNLNCRGCTHYSPLAAKEFADLDQTERAMQHIARVCGNKLKKVYLIGGETLLYPRLAEAIEALARNFKTQELYVFTNGLLIPRLSHETWDAFKKNNVIMAITRYPIKFDYDAAIDLCRQKGVRTEIFGDRSMADSFFRFALDPAKKQNGKIGHFKCFNRGCISVIGTKMYPCSISACVGHLNKACSTDFKHEKGDYLVVDEITDVNQILALRDSAVPFCDYCILPPSSVEYAPSQRKKSEWVDD